MHSILFITPAGFQCPIRLYTGDKMRFGNILYWNAYRPAPSIDHIMSRGTDWPIIQEDAVLDKNAVSCKLLAAMSHAVSCWYYHLATTRIFNGE